MTDADLSFYVDTLSMLSSLASSCHIIFFTKWKYSRERSRCSLVRKLRCQCYGSSRSISGERLKRIAFTHYPWQLLCKGLLFLFIRNQISFLAFGVPHSWRRRAWLSCDCGPQRSSKIRTRRWVAPKSDKSCITPYNVRFWVHKTFLMYTLYQSLVCMQLSEAVFFCWTQYAMVIPIHLWCLLSSASLLVF